MKKAFYIILTAITLLCYGSVLVSPGHFWIMGFFSLAIPLVLLFHFFLLIINIRRLRKNFLFHLLAIVVGFAFIKVSYSIHKSDDEGTISVLSYNVRVFNNYAQFHNENYISSKKMINWAVANKAQIKCFQEYYNKDKSQIFDVRKQLTAAGWRYNFSKIVLHDRAGAEFGQAIFSIYPIIATGEVRSEDDKFLNSIYADILINDDTVRIYNAHLESMSIDEENVVNTERLAESYKDTSYRLRRGFISRAKQTAGLVQSMRHCPYKILLCGDLNETPYSYPYFSLRGLLNNAFEKAGNGFGFTFNGKLFFLRIDNQFFSDGINIHSFMTHRNADFSDHFPITASYSW